MEKPSPVAAAKALKNDAELAGMREAHLRDAVALAETLLHLETQVREWTCMHERASLACGLHGDPCEWMYISWGASTPRHVPSVPPDDQAQLMPCPAARWLLETDPNIRRKP